MNNDLQSPFQLKSIGVISSCYKQKFGTPRQSGLVERARSVLSIDPVFQPELSLHGLQGFTHAWVIFIFHGLGDYSFHAKVHPPRLEGESMGVFATRSPHRPNPLGLSLVQLGKIEGNSIELWGGDFMDGTPVLDIKPYLKEVESKPLAKSGWAEGKEHFIPQAQFVYSSEAEQSLQKISLDFPLPSNPVDFFKNVLEETLLLDPRPQVYKNLDREHVLRLWDWDVFFTIQDSTIHLLRLVQYKGDINKS